MASKTKTTGSSKKAATKRTGEAGETPDQRSIASVARHVVWVVLVGLWLLAVVSLAGYDAGDWPSHSVFPHNTPIQNWCGPVGAALAYSLYAWLGPGVWLLLAGAAVCAIASWRGKIVGQPLLRTVGLFVCAIAGSGMVYLKWQQVGHMPEGSGGRIAVWFVELLTAHLATLGSALVLGAMFIIGAFVAVDELVLALPGRLLQVARQLNTLRGTRMSIADKLRRKPATAGAAGAEPRDVPIRHGRRAKAADDEAIDPEAGGIGATESFDPEQASVAVDEEPDAEEYEYEYEEEDDEEYEDDADDATAEDEARDVDPDAIRKKIAKLPIGFARKVEAEPPPPPIADYSGYQFPGMDLLVEPEHNFNETIASHVREQAEVLERALQTYRIDAEVVAIDAGPVITLYEVSLAPGTKVSAVNGVASDVARELKAQNIRVVPNTAGKSTVGIEVPNLTKETVRLKELMSVGGEKARDGMALPMYLGKDASGNPLISDLAKQPHMLIAGTTGSGKSVCMNTIIMSFLFTKRPDEVKLVLVDPKMVEMAQFKAIPHLMCPVVTDMGKAAAILEWAVTKMDERYALLADAGCRDIDSYNGLGAEELYDRMDAESEAEQARIPTKLPRMVFVIDELADLMMTNKDVEHHIVRIAQKARAVGMHLILATQRPQANVVTGLIKSNMPCRIAFKVSSGMDSRIVLDQKGAELLLGQGDMLYLSPRTSETSRAQGTLVDDAEIRSTVKFLKEVAEPSFEPSLVQIRSADHVDVDEEATRDPLFEKAVEIVLETQRGSVSLLQRRLTIGYSRSSRLIEAMAAAGILGSHKGSQAREVQISIEEWEMMKAQMAGEPEPEQQELFEGDADATTATTSTAASTTDADEAEDIDETEPADDEEVEAVDDSEEAGDDDDEYEYEYEYVEEEAEYDEDEGETGDDEHEDDDEPR